LTSTTELPPDFRIVFVGARIVGHRCLNAILNARANVVGLLTLDESKANSTTAFLSFEDVSHHYALSTRKFTRLDSPEIAEWIVSLQADLGIVVGVSQLLGNHLLQIPRLGFIGMHPTMLPQGRGRAPIPWALINGLKRTGVSWFYCAAGADTGDILIQAEVPIYYEDTSATLGSRTDDVAIKLLLECLLLLANGTAGRFSQDESLASTWPQRKPKDGLIDWTLTQREIYDWVRALSHPYPGAFTMLHRRLIWIWGLRESIDVRQGVSGEVLAVVPHGVLVATGQGNVLVTHVQWEGSDEIEAAQAGIVAGNRFGQ